MFREENEDFYTDRKTANRTKRQTAKQKPKSRLDAEPRIHIVGKSRDDKSYRNMERQYKNCDPAFVSDQFEDLDFEQFEKWKR